MLSPLRFVLSSRNSAPALLDDELRCLPARASADEMPGYADGPRPECSRWPPSLLSAEDATPTGALRLHRHR